MVALANAAQQASYPTDIALVLSNVPNAQGLERACSMGIKTETLAHKYFSSRTRFDNALHTTLLKHDIDLIACAGFMRILTAEFTKKWQGRILNIHPSLLPKYKGLHTHQRALDAGDAEHGCTVHHLTAELDGGPIIGQRHLSILATDTAETLAARVNKLELELYPECLALVARSFKPKTHVP